MFILDLDPQSAVGPIDLAAMAQRKQLIRTHLSLGLGRGNRSLPHRFWPVYVRVLFGLWQQPVNLAPTHRLPAWFDLSVVDWLYFCFSRQLANTSPSSVVPRRTSLKRATVCQALKVVLKGKVGTWSTDQRAEGPSLDCVVFLCHVLNGWDWATAFFKGCVNTNNQCCLCGRDRGRHWP